MTPSLHHLYIVTGASRGMGAAIAAQLLAPGNVLLCMARQVNPSLDMRAAAANARVEQWPVDLSEPVDVAAKMQSWIQGLDASAFASATLINNAATLTRIGPIDDCDDPALARSLRVGLEAPLLLSAAFLRATRTWGAEKRILNISSGLGRRAMAGQASYCATKAGMDHLTRAMALDEAARPGGAKVVSLAPGVIDTEMQVHLRAGDAAGFPEKENFVNLKANGQLASTDEAASKVLGYLARRDFGSKAVADVRDA